MQALNAEWRRALDEFGGSPSAANGGPPARRTAITSPGGGTRRSPGPTRSSPGSPRGSPTTSRRTWAASAHGSGSVAIGYPMPLRTPSVRSRWRADPGISRPSRLSLCTRALLRFEAGRLEEALADFKELVAIDTVADGLAAAGMSPTFAWLAVDLGCRPDVEEALEQSTARRWGDVGRLILAGEAVGGGRGARRDRTPAGRGVRSASRRRRARRARARVLRVGGRAPPHPRGEEPPRRVGLSPAL